MRKVFVIAVVVILSVLTGCRSKAPDLTGTWNQINSESEEAWHSLIIEGNAISIYWMADNGDTRSLYWAGTYIAPESGGDSYTWESLNDHDQTDNVMLASSDDVKEITYENGQLSYSTSIMGVTKTIRLEKDETIELPRPKHNTLEESEKADSNETSDEGIQKDSANSLNDLSGSWKQVNSGSEDSWQAAIIDGDAIAMYWVSDNGDTMSLYWMGSYDEPGGLTSMYSWDSENDHDQTDSALMASSDDNKEIVYENGQLSYMTSMLGTTTIVRLEKDDSVRLPKPVISLVNTNVSNVISNDGNAVNQSETPETNKYIRDLEGSWNQINSDISDIRQVAFVNDNSIEIYWASDFDERLSLYWAGTFDSSKSEVAYMWDSKNNYDLTNLSPFSSLAGSKEINVKDNQITYSMGINGSQYTIVLEKSEKPIDVKRATSNSDRIKTEKNGFNTYTNNIVTIVGYKIPVPDYYRYEPANDNSFVSIVERRGRMAMLKMNLLDMGGTYEETKENMQTNKEKYAERFFSVDDQYVITNAEIIETDDVWGLLLECSFVIGDHPASTKILVIPLEEEDKLLSINLSETNNSRYSYSDDFIKMILAIERK